MKVKICGIRTVAAAKAAEEAGADFIGFVFAASHRQVLPAQAALIAGCLQRCKTVGVFVDRSPAEVNYIADMVKLDYVQLHGHESPEIAKLIRRPVIKAFHWDKKFSWQEAADYPAELILIDSFSEDKCGGTGQPFCWQAAAEPLAKLSKPFFIAGGVDDDNAAAIWSVLHPWGIDVSSSLELHGKKSLDKIRGFMDRIKEISGR